MKRRSRIFWFAFSVFGIFGIVVACSNNGEGERCERFNGNDDCQDGLVCTPGDQLPANASGGDRCCPPDRSKATTSECAPVTASVGGDAQPNGETGPGADVNVSDAPMESSAETSTNDAADAADAADADADDGG